ncbi:MAG TPA: 23S ribosomal RNA methyltransferase Erm [Candidatus Saccharimonadales bacterium]|nr:23S ribosomal RNA methyltransferase Erm [Candidatus Saccharimonadales bacterium]
MTPDTRHLSHSQNFLISRRLVAELVGRAGIGVQDTVVEIGPGKGIITAELAARAGKVIAVEADPRLVPALQERFTDTPTVTIIATDFLRWPLPAAPYVVFANIPFNLTADIVRKLLDDAHPPHAAYLIMQEAAARKYLAPSGGPATQAAMLLYPFFEVSLQAHISRRQFRPVPRVNAVLAGFVARPQPLIDSAQRQRYRDFVVYSFNRWQPTLVQALTGVFPPARLANLATRWHLAGKKPSEATPAQWLALFAAFRELPVALQRPVTGAEQRLAAQQSALQKRHRTSA